MPFLSVLLSYLLSRYTAACQLLQRDAWFTGLLRALAALPAPLPFWLAVPGVALLVHIVWSRAAFWPAFLLGLLILLYSLGRGAWRRELPQVVQDWRDGKGEALWLSLQQDGFVDGGGRTERLLWQGLCRRAAWRYLDDLFAVFFWFMLGGPAAALLFRLVFLYRGQPAVPAWRLLLEWLPARYMGLCICLAGNFAGGFAVWRSLALDTHQSTLAFLGRCLDAALVVEPEYADECEEAAAAKADLAVRLLALQDLLARTEIIGLVGLATAVLLVA